MRLDSETVMVRLLETAGAEAYESYCYSLLAPEERSRADAFARPEPRLHFVLGRGLLRTLLAAELDVRPEAVAIGINLQGKPSTVGMEFNLSHTDGLIAVAMAREVRVGVDVERADSSLEILEVARTAFAGDDVDRIATAKAEEQASIFYALWTEREAIAKCLGRGILDPAALRGEWRNAAMRVLPLELPDPFHGAVAFEPTKRMRVDFLKFPAQCIFVEKS